MSKALAFVVLLAAGGACFADTVPAKAVPFFGDKPAKSARDVQNLPRVVPAGAAEYFGKVPEFSFKAKKARQANSDGEVFAFMEKAYKNQ